jgi:hypothetical protein
MEENLKASASECLKNCNNLLNQLFCIYDLILQNKKYEDPLKVIELLLKEEQKLQILTKKSIIN